MFRDETSHGDLSFGLLLQALRGVTLWRPNLVYGGCLLAGVGISVWLTSVAGDLGGAVSPFALLFAILIGYLAAGRLLIFDARGEPGPGLRKSLGFALRVWPRLLLLVLMEALLLSGIAFVEVLVFGVSRLPSLGPYLVIPLFPVTALFNAALLVLAIIVFNLSGPALWHGESVGKALQHTLRIASSRPGSILLMMLLLSILASAVALVIIVVLYLGYALTLATAAPFLGNSLFANGATEALLLQWLPSMSSDSLWAASLEPLTLWTQWGEKLFWFAAGILIFLLPSVVFLTGMAHLYLEALELESPEDV